MADQAYSFQQFPAQGEMKQRYQEEHPQPFSDPIPGQANASSAMKTYNMYYTTSRCNARLHLGSADTPCLYYLHLVLMTTSKPQIELRRGDSKTSPMVAFAKVQRTSRHLLIGSGNHEKGLEEQLVWEEMRRVKNVLHCNSDYEFGTSLGPGHRKMYTWKRDKHQTAKNCYTCVDNTGQVLGSMLSGGMLNWKKGGELSVAEGLDQDLTELLMVSGLGIWAAEAFSSYLQGYSSG